MSIGYHREKLGTAVDHLVGDDKPLRERLLAAFIIVDQLNLADLLQEMPEPVRLRLESIVKEASTLGSYKESIAVLTDDRARHIAEEIAWPYAWTCEIGPTL